MRKTSFIPFFLNIDTLTISINYISMFKQKYLYDFKKTKIKILALSKKTPSLAR